MPQKLKHYMLAATLVAGATFVHAGRYPTTPINATSSSVVEGLPYVDMAFRGLGLPTTILIKKPSFQELNKLVILLTKEFCRVELNPTHAKPGAFVIYSSSTDPVDVGKAFLRKAASSVGANLSYFDPLFVERWAEEIGKAILSGKNKIQPLIYARRAAR